MMEKEKKPRAPKKTKTTANPSGPSGAAVESIDAKKAPAKKKAAVAEMSVSPNVSPVQPKKVASPKKAVATPAAPSVTSIAAEPRVTQMRVSHEEIARLAHRYWAERGGQHGNHVEDWLRAERELRGKAS
jgi:hypothetical protein